MNNLLVLKEKSLVFDPRDHGLYIVYRIDKKMYGDFSSMCILVKLGINNYLVLYLWQQCKKFEVVH